MNNKLIILLVVFGLAETVSGGENQKTILTVSGGAEVLLQVPAWSEVLVGGRVVVLEPDFLHLAAYDAKTGKRRWRRKFQKKANGGQRLHLIDGKLFAWTGNKIQVVNPRNGFIGKTFDAAWNRNSQRCKLGQEGDTCYFSCQCRFWMFDCASGEQLGPKLKKNHVEFHDLDGGSSGGCYGPGHKIIGRAGDLLVMSKQGKRAEDDKRYGRPIEIVGLDTKTGEESWRCAECAPDEYFFFSGVSEDEAICWLGNYTGALRVFSCQTGKLHFSGDLTPKDKPHTWRRTAITWLEKPRGLFRYFDGQAEMLDGETGKPIWSKKVDPDLTLLPLGAPVGYFLTDKKPREVQLIDPSSGDLVTSISLGPFGSITSDGSGGFIALSTTSRFFTAAGKERGQLAQAASSPLHRGDGFFAFRTKGGGLFVNAKTLEILGSFKGVVSEAAMDHRTPAGTLLLHGFPPERDKPGETVLLRVARPAN